MAAPGVPSWQQQILAGVAAPVTPQNLLFVNDWQRAEGGGAANNPFNTTEPGFGATGDYNPVGVKNYATPAQGVAATVATLKNGRYGNILAALRQGASAAEAARALAASPWGTGALVEKMLAGSGSAAPVAQARPSLATAAAAPAQAAPAVPQVNFAALIRQAAAKQIGTGSLDQTGFYNTLGNLLRQRAAVQAAPFLVPHVPAQQLRQQIFQQPLLPLSNQRLLPFTGATVQGVKPSLLDAVSNAARAAGATSIDVTSGARSAQHNAQVGGVPDSNHLTGDALDGYGIVNGRKVPLGQLLLKVAGRYGLRSGDVPGFFNGGTDPVHVDDGRNQR